MIKGDYRIVYLAGTFTVLSLPHKLAAPCDITHTHIEEGVWGGAIKKMFHIMFYALHNLSIMRPWAYEWQARQVAIVGYGRSLKDPQRYSLCVCCGRRLGVILYTHTHNPQQHIFSYFGYFYNLAHVSRACP